MRFLGCTLHRLEVVSIHARYVLILQFWNISFLSFFFLSSKVKEGVFYDHPHIEHLAEQLLHVFVTIEMRGQSVDSEMKFNYRKSMHRVLQFICDIPVHRKAVRVGLLIAIFDFLFVFLCWFTILLTRPCKAFPENLGMHFYAIFNYFWSFLKYFSYFNFLIFWQKIKIFFIILRSDYS